MRRVDQRIRKSGNAQPPRYAEEPRTAPERLPKLRFPQISLKPCTNKRRIASKIGPSLAILFFYEYYLPRQSSATGFRFVWNDARQCPELAFGLGAPLDTRVSVSWTRFTTGGHCSGFGSACLSPLSLYLKVPRVDGVQLRRGSAERNARTESGLPARREIKFGAAESHMLLQVLCSARFTSLNIPCNPWCRIVGRGVRRDTSCLPLSQSARRVCETHRSSTRARCIGRELRSDPFTGRSQCFSSSRDVSHLPWARRVRSLSQVFRRTRSPMKKLPG